MKKFISLLLILFNLTYIYAQDTCVVSLKLQYQNSPLEVIADGRGKLGGFFSRGENGELVLFTNSKFVKVVNLSNRSFRDVSGENRIITFDQGRATIFDKAARLENGRIGFGEVQIGSFRNEIFFGNDIYDNTITLALERRKNYEHKFTVKRLPEDFDGVKNIGITVTTPTGEEQVFAFGEDAKDDTIYVLPGSFIKQFDADTEFPCATDATYPYKKVKTDHRRIYIEEREPEPEPVEESNNWIYILIASLLVVAGLSWYLYHRHQLKKAGIIPETDAEKIKRLSREVASHIETIGNLTSAKQNLENNCSKLNDSLASLKAETSQTIAETNAKAEAEIAETKANAEAAMNQMRAEADADIAQTNAKAAQAMEEARVKAAAEIETAKLNATNAVNAAQEQAKNEVDAANMRADKAIADITAKAENEMAMIKEKAENEVAIAKGETKYLVNDYISFLQISVNKVREQMEALDFETLRIPESNHKNVIKHFTAKFMTFSQWFDKNILPLKDTDCIDKKSIEEKVTNELVALLNNNYSWLVELSRFYCYATISHEHTKVLARSIVPISFIKDVYFETTTLCAKLGITLIIPQLFNDTFVEDRHKLINTPLIFGFFSHDLLTPTNVENSGVIYDLLKPGYSVNGEVKQLPEVCAY